MRHWSLKKGDPLHLILSADANLEPTSYVNDHIWALMLSGGNPPALALQTTFGLRAQDFRIFPTFIDTTRSITNPEEFTRVPILNSIETNYAKLEYSPFTGIDVVMEYWVPGSQGCCGRFTITNSDQIQRRLKVDLIAQLKPVEGERMAPVTIQACRVLAGKTGDLFPLIFLSGGSSIGSGAYPSLSTLLELNSGESRDVIWYQSACGSLEDSFKAARSIAERKWDSEIARLDVYHSGKLIIETGDPDWDAALASSQRFAFSMSIGPTTNLPHASFVLSRTPDRGYSILGSGIDYDSLWNGQTPLDTYFLLRVLLPNSITFAKGLIENFISCQEVTGQIDWKPGLSGNRSHLQATPILSHISWLIYGYDRDKSFLEKIYPSLLAFFQQWFDASNDRDSDQFPEWSHPFQTGFDDHPLYTPWTPSSRGLEISTIEPPSLASFLYRDCQALISISSEIEQEESISDLEIIAKKLKSTIEKCWSSELSRYLDRDRDSHNHPPEELLGKRNGPGTVFLKRSFKQKARLLISIHTTEGSTCKPQILIRGRDKKGRYCTEVIAKDKMKWYSGRCSVTTQSTFSYIDWIDIMGIDESVSVEISTVGFLLLEISNLIPLWAGIPDYENARKLIEGLILNPDIFLSSYGLSACSKQELKPETRHFGSIYPIWNLFIMEGLVNYGYRTEAAQIFTRMLNAVVKTLKDENGFRKYYDLESGKGYGDRNCLTGVIPTGLFMNILGVDIYSSKKIRLAGHNPFPWSVTIQFKGMMIIRHPQETRIIFPDGQSVEVKSPTPTTVFLEDDQIRMEFHPDS